MNHYPRHIGDYLKDTIGLTLAQEGIYCRALDLYYSQEHMLPKGVELELAMRCHGAADLAALRHVLARYFEERDTGYWHKRCEEEIQAYRDRVESARIAGRASATKRQRNANGYATSASTHPQRNGNEEANDDPNGQPYNDPISHKPLTKRSSTSSTSPANGKPTLGSRLSADWRIPEDWIEWTLEAYPAVDRTAVVRLSLEFRDYWCALPGKAGLKSDWLATWRNRCRQRLENG